MMTPGVTNAPFSEAMPLHPHNADEVIAVNLGSSVYTLTGSITGGDVALDAGETAILVYAGSTAGWYVTWRSATGAVSYPISVDHGGTGADLSGANDGDTLAFNIGTGKFEAVPFPSVSYPISVAHGGTGIDGTGALLFAATGTVATFSSLDGISLLAQTSAADGSNTNPTAVFRANTGQTAMLVSLQHTAGGTSAFEFGAFDDGSEITNWFGGAFSAAFTPGSSEVDFSFVGGGGGHNITISASPTVSSIDIGGPAGDISLDGVTGNIAATGNIDAATFSVASTPGDSGTDITGNVFVNGICTSVATT